MLTVCSDFGDRFKFAAKRAKATQARHDSFEAGMVQLKNEDWKGFMEALQDPDL